MSYSLAIALLLGVLFSFVEETPVATQGETSLYLQRSGDDLRKMLFQEISHAKESIDIALYALTDEGLLNLLKKKANEGVKVSLVYDSEATPTRSFGKICALPDQSKGLMHLKLFVIDGQISLIGSANGSFASLRHYSNSVCRVDSSEIACFIQEKIKALSLGGTMKHRVFDLGGAPLEIWFLPDDQMASKRLVDLMRTAKKTINVAMYTFTRLDFADELIAAKERGVDVALFLDRSSSEGASLKVYEKLKKAGVFVKLSAGKSLLHDKMVAIDDKTLVLGSANWTKAAFTKNDDCFIVLGGLSEEKEKKLKKLFDTLRVEPSW